MRREELSIKGPFIFVAAPRSGSTLFMRIMSGFHDVAVTSRNVLMGNMKSREFRAETRDFIPDYSIYTNRDHPIYSEAARLGKHIVVSKEEFGNDRHTGTPELNECNYPIFPSDHYLQQSKPIFTFRHPYEVYDSWLKQGWDDINSFVITYNSLVDLYTDTRAKLPETVFYTYDYLTENPTNQHRIFTKVCEHWGINFSPEAFVFDQPFGENFVYAKERERKIYKDENPAGIFDTLKESKGIISGGVKGHGLITDRDKSWINTVGLVAAYEQVHRECLAYYANSTATNTAIPQDHQSLVVEQPNHVIANSTLIHS